jgi:hypothetical protein
MATMTRISTHDGRWTVIGSTVGSDGIRKLPATIASAPTSVTKTPGSALARPGACRPMTITTSTMKAAAVTERARRPRALSSSLWAPGKSPLRNKRKNRPRTPTMIMKIWIAPGKKLTERLPRSAGT